MSRTLTGYGRYAIYASSPPDHIPEWIAGGFKRAEDAIPPATKLANEVGFDPPPDEPRRSFVPAHDAKFAELVVGDLVADFESNLKRDFKAPTKGALLAHFASARFYFGVIPLVAIAMFIFNFRIKVPAGIDIPLIGQMISGWSLNRGDVAYYLPYALLILLAVVVLPLAKRNLANDRLRRLILELAIFHRWRRAEFAKAARKSFWLGDGSWVFSAVEVAQAGCLGKALGARPWRSRQPVVEVVESGEYSDRMKALEVEIDTEFERRIHNMYWLERQAGYKPYLMAFHPFLYVMNLNRIRWSEYKKERQKGTDPFQLPTVQDPDSQNYDVRGSAILWTILIILAIPLTWAAFLLVEPTLQTYLFHILASIAFIGCYVEWFRRAIVKRQGFPVHEPTGAYTVDFLPNKLSLPGY